MQTHRNSWTQVLFLGAACASLFACQGNRAAAPDNAGEPVAGQRPNIVFIMTDDHAYQAISAYGSVLNETPNIDRIAREGMRFDRAYVSNSICSPSRAVILTGKHSHLNGVRDNIGAFDGTQQTLPKLLQQSGYETAMIGKWHLKSEPTGFDYWRVLPGQGAYYQPDFLTPKGRVRMQGYVTDLITDLALDWLSERRDPGKPFLLMYQHKAPHRAWMPSQDHLGAFMGTPLPEPDTLFDDYSGRGRAAAEAEMRIADHMALSVDNKLDPALVDEGGYSEFLEWYGRNHRRNLSRLTAEERQNWDAVYEPVGEAFRAADPRGDELTRWKYQRYMQDYLASIASVDDNIGRLLDYLEASGLADNTIVVYTSDQGFYLGEHGWFDKRFMYEQSFRTPLLVRWPGMVNAGTVNSELVQNLDFAPTLLEAAGATVPADMQGISMVPLLTGQGGEWREALYYHYYEYPGIHAVKRHYGIATRRYKLIHFYHDVDEWELYDLQADPAELNNVFGQEPYAAIQARLESQLESLRRHYGDSDELTQAMLRSDLERERGRP
jgi:arylsulfatase A-like enzyme